MSVELVPWFSAPTKEEFNQLVMDYQHIVKFLRMEIPTTDDNHVVFAVERVANEVEFRIPQAIHVAIHNSPEIEEFFVDTNNAESGFSFKNGLCVVIKKGR